MSERVIESVTYEVAGRGNCVQQDPSPARHSDVIEFFSWIDFTHISVNQPVRRCAYRLNP